MFGVLVSLLWREAEAPAVIDAPAPSEPDLELVGSGFGWKPRTRLNPPRLSKPL